MRNSEHRDCHRKYRVHPEPYGCLFKQTLNISNYVLMEAPLLGTKCSIKSNDLTLPEVDGPNVLSDTDIQSYVSTVQVAYWKRLSTTARPSPDKFIL